MPPAGKNQNREQIARAETDARLAEPGWHVQDRNSIDFTAGQGSAVGPLRASRSALNCRAADEVR